MYGVTVTVSPALVNEYGPSENVSTRISFPDDHIAYPTAVEFGAAVNVH
jgi:hypothetical protein